MRKQSPLQKRPFSWLAAFFVLACCFCPNLSYAALTKIPAEFTRTAKKLKVAASPYQIIVSIDAQILTLFKNEKWLAEYPISTSKLGPGQLLGSYQTPLGLHRIEKKVGKGDPLYTIYYGRVNSGKCWTKEAKEYAEEDLVLSRILWLKGLEKGINLGKDSQGKVVDSFQRFIYIHGTNHEDQIGKATSKGCIRMNSHDLLQLFDEVPEGTLVWIDKK